MIHRLTINLATLLAVLFCFTSCQSSGTAGQQSLEMREGDVVSFSLHPKDDGGQATWDESYSRKVWFELQRANGEPVGRFISGIFFADEGLGDSKPSLNPTHLELTITKDVRRGYLLRNVADSYSSLCCGSPGHYILKFRVECRKQENQVTYSGATDTVRLNVSSTARDLLNLPAAPPTLDLGVSPELKAVEAPAEAPAAESVAPAVQ